LEDQVRRQVSAALQALLDARAAIRTSEHGLQAAEESYRVRRALFQNGRATSTELLDAELDLTRARRSALGARLELRMARARLEFAVGWGAGRPNRAS
jgi:outer membrane protein TolC